MININSQIMQLKLNIKFFENELNTIHSKSNSKTTNQVLFAKKDILEKRKERVQQIFHTLKNTLSTFLENAKGIDSNNLTEFEDVQRSWNTISDKVHENLSITEEAFELLEKIKAVCKKIECFHTRMQEQAKKSNELKVQTELVHVPTILKNYTVQQFLKNSLPIEIKKISNKYPVLFSCAESLVKNILDGIYGETIKQDFINKSGDIYTQKGFIKLLLIDMCRSNVPLIVLEFIKEIVENKKLYTTKLPELESLFTEDEIKTLEDVLKEISPKTVHAVYTNTIQDTQSSQYTLFNKVVAQLLQETIVRKDPITDQVIELALPYKCFSTNLFSNLLLPYVSLQCCLGTDILHECILFAIIKNIDGVKELLQIASDNQFKQNLDFLFALLEHSNSKNRTSALLINTENHKKQLEKFIKILVNAGCFEKAIEFILSLPSEIKYISDKNEIVSYDVHNLLCVLAVTTLSYIDEDQAIAITDTLFLNEELALSIIAMAIGYKNPEKALELVKSLSEEYRYPCEMDILWSVAEANCDKAFKLIEQINPKMKDQCLYHICNCFNEQKEFENAWKFAEAISIDSIRFECENAIISGLAMVDLNKALELFENVELENRDPCLVSICIALAIKQEAENAFEFAGKIAIRELQFVAKQKIIENLAIRDTSKAIELLDRVDIVQREDCIYRIVDACMTQKNELETAFKLLKTITNQNATFRKVQQNLIGVIAINNIPKALELLEQVHPEAKNNSIFLICCVLIEQKEDEKAWEILKTISDEILRDEIEKDLIKVKEDLIQEEDSYIIDTCKKLIYERRFKEAQELANLISDPEKRDKCLMSLKQTALENKEVAEDRSTSIDADRVNDSHLDNNSLSSDDE